MPSDAEDLVAFLHEKNKPEVISSDVPVLPLLASCRNGCTAQLLLSNPCRPVCITSAKTSGTDIGIQTKLFAPVCRSGKRQQASSQALLLLLMAGSSCSQYRRR